MVKIAPTMDAPSVVPTSRKKLLAAVTVPTISDENSFWAMSPRISELRPRPKPSTNR